MDALTLLHGVPAVLFIVMAAVALHFSSSSSSVNKVTPLSSTIKEDAFTISTSTTTAMVDGELPPPLFRHRNIIILIATCALIGIGGAFYIRSRWFDVILPLPIGVGESFRTSVVKQQPPALASTYGGTPLYSPVSVVANANYSCFSGTTPLSCAAWFCNMSTTIANGYQTRSCEMTATVVNYAAKVAAISKKTCTQSTNARCTTAALTALFGNFAGVFAAYCTDSFLVIISSGKSRTQSYNLDNIPYPPGGNDATGACRTRTASITDQLSEAGIPLNPVALPTAAYTNNKNTNVWPLGAVVSIFFYHC